MKKNSLKVEIWKYLAIFSILILVFLWIFQVLFLNQYYSYVKRKELKQVGTTLKNQINTTNLAQIIDNLAYDKSICIEITDDRNNHLFTSSIVSRGCLSNMSNAAYKIDFISRDDSSKMYEIENPRFKNKTLVYAVRLSNDQYAFINTSIDPMDSTTKILKNQLIYVSLLVLILSFLSAYFISKHISNPIVKMNKAAKRLAKGEFNVVFDDCSNIQELNELANSLNYARDELSKTDELRRDLMANVSHDLKTPLTMIKAYAEMTKDLNPTKEKRMENMNIISEEVDRLTLLVNDILVLSKLQSETEYLKLETFDLTTLIQTILKRYDVFRIKENYTFIFTSKKKIFVHADKKKIEQVIYNLINNAINYTGEDNKVEIILEESSSEIMVKIIDSGEGIKEKDIPYIWDRYYKNEKNHKRTIVGTGLGLSIVKTILEQHHFSYGVLSTKMNGTTFYFTLPKETKIEKEK